MGIDKLKNKLSNKIKNNKFFTKTFGFESGVDITDDTQVLHRKNVVIKNIIFVSNLLYTVLFTILSIDEPSNWLLTILFFPITFFVNLGFKKMINKSPNDRVIQTIGMYVQSAYMFLTATLLYIRLRTGASYLKECGYIMLYYSLAVCAFYQDKKMLKNVFLWVFILVTILHFTVTYDIINADYTTSIVEFFQKFFTTNDFRDILVRTIMLLLFMLVLYISVYMANYMQEERKKELAKRREVQEDFTNVVTKIFDATLATSARGNDDAHDAEILAQMAKKLASLLSKSPEVCDNIYNFAKLHTTKAVDFNSRQFESEDERFEALREQTELGSELITRYQLARKCEDIIRATFEGSDDDDFIASMANIQNDDEAQIILICDIYVSMRSVMSYKKAYNHNLTMKYMNDKFQIYFNPVIFNRFVRFDTDFENIYNEM